MTETQTYITTSAGSDRGNVHLSKTGQGHDPDPAGVGQARIITLEPICGATALQKITKLTGSGTIEIAFAAYEKATTLTGPYNAGGIAPWRCSKCWHRGLRLRYHPER